MTDRATSYLTVKKLGLRFDGRAKRTSHAQLLGETLRTQCCFLTGRSASRSADRRAADLTGGSVFDARARFFRFVLGRFVFEFVAAG